MKKRAFKLRLRKETSLNCSGKLLNSGKVEVLKLAHYNVMDYNLDGDAPKQFIKAYFYSPYSSVRKAKPQSWISYIAKSAEKWYPHESVIEFMINRIGEVLGLNMNGIRLVKSNGQIRFLSRYFLRPGEALIHGAEICGQYLDDMDFAARVANDKKTARDLFTFEFIEQAIQSVFPASAEAIMLELVKLIIFDALVGNNDRHFYNWAVIRAKNKSLQSPLLAPIYDSARGLLWNTSDEKIEEVYQNQKNCNNFVVKYVKNAYARISIEGGANVDHFQLLAFLRSERPQFRSMIQSLASEEAQKTVLKLIEKEFAHFFIPERTQLIVQILEARFTKVRMS